jgi:hypothetical protein
VSAKDIASSVFLQEFADQLIQGARYFAAINSAQNRSVRLSGAA